MTRQFNQTVQCPYCHATIDAETDFCRWMRHNRELDSKINGVVRADMDHVIHRYKTNRQGREFQLLMVVEVKTNSAMPAPTQIDTLHILNQLIRNRSQNIHQKPKRQAGHGPYRVLSFLLGREILTRCYGVHLLQLSGTDPDNSQLILWDRKPISPQQLTQLLKLDLDPDTLKPTDLRDHHFQNRNQPDLIAFEQI